MNSTEEAKAATEEETATRMALDDDDNVNLESSIVKPFPLQQGKQSKYRMVKRAAPHGPAIQPNDIYLSRKSNYGSLVKRAKTILERKQHGGRVIVHGLGSALEETCNLALQVQREMGGPKKVEIAPQTSTVKLVDDFEPCDNEGEPISQIRYNSAMRIELRLVQQQQQEST